MFPDIDLCPLGKGVSFDRLSVLVNVFILSEQSKNFIFTFVSINSCVKELWPPLAIRAKISLCLSLCVRFRDQVGLLRLGHRN